MKKKDFVKLLLAGAAIEIGITMTRKLIDAIRVSSVTEDTAADYEDSFLAGREAVEIEEQIYRDGFEAALEKMEDMAAAAAQPMQETIRQLIDVVENLCADVVGLACEAIRQNHPANEDWSEEDEFDEFDDDFDDEDEFEDASDEFDDYEDEDECDEYDDDDDEPDDEGCECGCGCGGCCNGGCQGDCVDDSEEVGIDPS